MANRFDDSNDLDGDNDADAFFDRLDRLATRAGQLTGAEARHVITAVNHLRMAEFHLRIAVETSCDPRFTALADRFRDGAAELALAAVTFGEAGQPTPGARH